MNILQLTDLHLMRDPDATLKGVPTHASLVDVLQFVRQGVDDGRWNFDLVAITGDLAHDEQLATYQQLRELLGDWVSRCQLIPGNHDDRAFIREVFSELVQPDSGWVTFSIEAAQWRLIGLDSHVPGEVFGRVHSDQLAWLKDELSKHATQPTLLFIHHPPFAVHSKWLDAIGLQEPEELLEIIRSSSQIQAVCAGHVHQPFEGSMGDVKLYTSPGTGVQFRPAEDIPIYDAVPPGFRTFTIDGDQFQTEVVRLPELKYHPGESGKDWTD